MVPLYEIRRKKKERKVNQNKTISQKNGDTNDKICILEIKSLFILSL